MASETISEMAFDHGEAFYFAVDGMPLEQANNYLKVRTRKGEGMLKFWHIPVQSGAEVNSKLLPYLYIGAYARHLVRSHHVDFNGWEHVLLSSKCIQCFPIEGNEVYTHPYTCSRQGVGGRHKACCEVMCGLLATL